MKPAAAPSATLETRLLTAAELTGWARSAVPGEIFVYCTGPSVPEGPTKAKVRELVAARVADPHNRRREGVLEHYLRKRPDVPPALESPPPHDEAMDRIFEALERRAIRRERAPSLTDLARIARLATREQARHRLTKLEAAGKISSETVPGPDGPWRIVTIGGLSTARPPAKERAQNG